MSHPPPGAPDPGAEPAPLVGGASDASPGVDRQGRPTPAPLVDAASGASSGGCCWRIDDLARRADVPVDTIRYYQRERLLPPGERAGRANLYGAEHLERLERIKHLQERRFSLAAIRALLSGERRGMYEDLFGSAEGRSYTLDELIERSGIDHALANDARAAGLLRDPAEFGRDAYDSNDLDLLTTLAELHGLGLPRQAVVEIARTYAEGIEATQRRIIELFTSGGRLTWDDAELLEFQEAAAGNASSILPLARRLVDYTHQRTMQRLTLNAIDADPIEGADAS